VDVDLSTPPTIGGSDYFDISPFLAMHCRK
jgi:hypothetical protein